MQNDTMINAGKKEYNPIGVMPFGKVTGNENVAIVSNEFVKANESCKDTMIILHLKNNISNDISRVIFSIDFYGSGGQVIQSKEQSIFDLQADSTRTVVFSPERSMSHDVTGYYVRILDTIIPPAPVLTGNEYINIYKHDLVKDEDVHSGHARAELTLAISNISNITIATAVFDVSFLNDEGQVLEYKQQKEREIKVGTNRGVVVEANKEISRDIYSYRVSINKITTVETEKAQIVFCEANTLDEKTDSIFCVIKNISDETADTAFVAEFINKKQVRLGYKSVAVRQIPPHGKKQFRLTFEAPAGEKTMNIKYELADLIWNDDNP
jgi:hypothetical protein